MYNIFLTFLVISLAVLVSGCSQNTETEETPTTDPTETVEVTLEPNETPEEEEEYMESVRYEIDMTNFAFQPNEISMNAGETIKVKIVNSEGFHDLVIDELNVKSKQLKEGEEEILEITVPEDTESGTYEFYCSVGNHREQGMVGTLRVL